MRIWKTGDSTNISKKPAEIQFTSHARAKMRFYNLSEARVRRVLHSPKRIEEGIAPGTIAMLQGAGSAKHPYEIWTMVAKTQTNADYTQTDAEGSPRGSALSQRKSAVTRVISAWRYPGMTKPGQPLPEVILQEFREAI